MAADPPSVDGDVATEAPEDLYAEGADAFADEASFSDLARAKINLFLHVRGRRPDGRHTLESFAVFPDLGDRLHAEPSPIRSLSIDGPFGLDLGSDAENLVLCATEAYADALDERRGVALRLVKRLPVASGIGGGSADAAATLRLLSRLWGRTLPAPALDRLALSLGADVPVCLASAPSLMGGIGEELASPPPFPGFWLVLVNPLRQVSTAEVFGSLERRSNPPADRLPARFADFGALVAWLALQRNDLEAPARSLAPGISAALSALRWRRSCRLARMSGSGATCFGLFATQREALAAADAIRRKEPGWWIAPARVKPWTGTVDGDDRADA